VASLIGAEQQAFFAAHGVLAVYLFGSRAKGEARPHSDYDLAVLFADYRPEEHNAKQKAPSLLLRRGR
jgi:predicted nucleotidyltransferase